MKKTVIVYDIFGSELFRGSIADVAHMIGCKIKTLYTIKFRGSTAKGLIISDGEFENHLKFDHSYNFQAEPMKFSCNQGNDNEERLSIYSRDDFMQIHQFFTSELNFCDDLLLESD